MPVSKAQIEKHIKFLHDAKMFKKEAEQSISEVEPEVIRLLDAMEKNKYTAKLMDMGIEITATVVSPVSEVLDEARLRKALGADVFDKLTTKTLDQDKLKSAMLSGAIDPRIVAQCSAPVERKRYVRVSESQTTSGSIVPLHKRARSKAAMEALQDWTA
jgi:hypothetical protein